MTGPDVAVLARAEGTHENRYVDERVQAVVIPTIPGAELLSLEYEHFVGCVLENCPVRADGVDGLRAAQVLEARWESLKNHGMPVDPGKF